MSQELIPVPVVETSTWTTAQKLLEIVEPCDIIEIRYEKAKPPTTHFVFNIKKGWCVSVIRAVDATNNVVLSNCNNVDEDNIYEGFKDAVDLLGLAGRNLCRINNLDDFVMKYNLTPRTRKDALRVSRAGLAEGAIISSIRSKIPGDPTNGEDISRQFCLHWKYNGVAGQSDIKAHKFLDKTIAVCGLVLVLLAAVVATTLSM